MQFSPLRTAIIAIVAVLGILFTVPSFLPKDVLQAWPGFLPKQTVVLGLDLQGGSHLLLQVNRDNIVTERIKTLRRELDASRARGYTVCDEEIELGVRSIAVPIHDRQGATIAALTISTRAERTTVAEMAQAFLPALLRNQAWARNQLG